MVNKELLDQYNPSLNFWEYEPQFKHVGPFKEVYEADKTKSKKFSSGFMWFIAFCYDMGSKFRKLDVNEKHAIIGEDFCGTEDFYKENKDKLDICIRLYCDMADSEGEKALREWEDGMRDRRQFLTDTSYAPDTYKMLEDMRKGTKALYDDLARIKKQIDSEAEASRAKGGKHLSPSDTGDLN
jgi:hypothetical protein